jgi:hypothetical protein
LDSEDPFQSGSFCVFTEDFFIKDKSHNTLEDLPIFQPGNVPLFEIEDDLADEIEQLYDKMKKEINSDYIFKYDLIRIMFWSLFITGRSCSRLQNYQHQMMLHCVLFRCL